MKKVLFSSILLFTALQLSAQNDSKTLAIQGADTVIKTVVPVLENLLDSFSYAAGINVATNMKAQGISNLNTVLMQKAIYDVFNNQPALLTPESGNECLQRQLAIFSAEKSNAEKAAGEAFLEANKKRPGVITLPSGLQYEIIKNGDANTPTPKPVDTVVVNYIVGLTDGTEIQSSYKSGRPAAFPVTGVIKGWIEILQLMRVGDQWKVYVPTELAYGAAGGAGGAIPPNAALVFDMVLEGIRPAAAVATETPKIDQ